ncbi:MAG: type II secretion system F family protein [Gammaproteobacteria bacterium]|nr:type II secretion system F family protein [Gammaproteobacteria bacterium]
MATTKTLLVFIWQGKNKSGATVSGEMRASNATIVKAELRRQGVVPTKIKKKGRPLFSFLHKNKIGPSDIAVFTRQLSTMLSAGIPIVQSFDILERGQTNMAFKNLLNQIRVDVESGVTLSNALRKYPNYFNSLYCNLVSAGEQSGTLDDMLIRIADYREKIESMKDKVKKALFYPTAVVTIAFVITAGLLIFVVPKFQSVFASFGAKLPTATLVVIQISLVFQHYWWLIFGGIGMGIWGFFRLRQQSQRFAQRIDEYALRMPIIGKILHKSAVARFARTLSTTFAAGLPLIEGLQAVSSAAGSEIYARAILQVRDEVGAGQTIHQAMANTNIFPPMVVQMVAIGEEAGSLEFMLSKVADFYEDQVDNAVAGLSSLLEPIIMVVLGTLIGGLVIAMYLPIFRMGNVIAGGGG